MKKNLLIIILIIVLCTLAWHTLANQVEQNFEMPMTIQGEDLIVDTVSEEAQFIGNVKAVYRDFQISSELLQFRIKDDLVKIVEISGNVEITGDQLKATAENAQIDLQTELITLTGAVEVYFKEQLIRGSQVTYDLKTGHLKAKDAQVIIQDTGK